MGDRDQLKEFWESRSDSPSVETMMLNKDAESFDEQDRRDIWISLPDLKGLRVVEIGSGIGRFTAALASVAKHVLATDFVQSFIEKNEIDNGHLGNVSFKCADAAHLNMDSESCDFVFTNWLLMYLTDVEVVHFLQSVMRWLTPNGYLHFRESCSESSKRTPTNPNDSSNPTHYRHICQYLTLLDRIRFRDEQTGKLVRFEVLWAKSVETYVRRPSHQVIPNWRQIHMLLRKVWADEEDQRGSTEVSSLVQALNEESVQDKVKFEHEMKTRIDLWGARSPMEQYFLKLLQEQAIISQSNSVLTLFGKSATSVSPFVIAETFDCSVQDLNTCFWTYDYNLAQANAKGDKRMRFQYVPGIVHDTKMWQYVPDRHFDVVVGCLVNDSVGKLEDTLAVLMAKVKTGGRIVLLEKLCGTGVDALASQCNGHGSIETQDVTQSVSSVLIAARTQLERAPELQKIQHEYEDWLKNNHGAKWYVVSVMVK